LGCPGEGGMRRRQKLRTTYTKVLKIALPRSFSISRDVTETGDGSGQGEK
jgi:hypothetical protein